MDKLFKLLKSEWFWLTLIILIGFTVRLYKIDNPIADWHSWRQADTAAVARNFYKDGYNPFIPKYDDMSGVAEKPYPNKERYRFVEFPIYNSIVYFGYLLNGEVDEAVARLVSVFISLGSLVLVYLITRKYFGVFTAMMAAFLFAVLPFNIYYSRVILPEPILVFFSLGMFYFTDRWIREKTIKLMFWSVLFTTLAFLTKPVAIFYLLPLLYVYITVEKKWWPPTSYWIFLLSFVPYLLWRAWINQHPEGIPAANWLLNGTDIRFKPSFFRWIIGDRFGREILGATGLVFFVVGLLKKPDLKAGFLLHLLALSSFLYLIVFATGNVQHDYYQTFIIPAVAIFTSFGFVSLVKGIPGFLPRIITIPIALFLMIMTIYLTWDQVKGLYQVNNPSIVEAGREADRMLPKNAVVVAPYQGDTSFLYQTNRPGWPVVGLPIEELKQKFGVTHFVSTAKDAKTKWVMRRYMVLVEKDNYVIVDLTNQQPGFDLGSDPEPQ